jgi:hypothetical protein
LLGNELAAERGFSDLARASQEHHFFSQVGLYTVIKVAFHAVNFATNRNDYIKKLRLY